MTTRINTVEGVTPVKGEIAAFSVESDRKGHIPYRVDLACYGGNGRCDCPQYRIRMEPVVSRGENCGVPIRCKHILRARRFFVDELIAKLLREGKVHDDAKQQH